MEKGEHVRRMAISMLENAGYEIDFNDTVAIIRALAEYEEKYKAMLEHVLM